MHYKVDKIAFQNSQPHIYNSEIKGLSEKKEALNLNNIVEERPKFLKKNKKELKKIMKAKGSDSSSGDDAINMWLFFF